MKKKIRFILIIAIMTFFFACGHRDAEENLPQDIPDDDSGEDGGNIGNDDNSGDDSDPSVYDLPELFEYYFEADDFGKIFCVISGFKVSNGKNVKIRIPKKIGGISVRRIESSADCGFSGNNLSSVVIPNSVVEIGSAVFKDCTGLTDITIPGGIESIEWDTFENCSGMRRITIKGSISNLNVIVGAIPSSEEVIVDPLDSQYCSLDGIVYNKTQTEVKYVPKKKTECTLPSTLTSIGERAFFDCENLTGITIPDSVTSIGERAFYRCLKIGSITIPSGVTSIENRTFTHCQLLTEITIPDSITSIGAEAFRNCSSLEDVFYSGTKNQWSEITKASDWKPSLGNFTVHCSDGVDIPKDEA